MGGGGSKPIEPVIIEDEPPAGSEETSIVYPNRPGLPRLDGISRVLANECKNCNLQVLSGISSSSVKISREFGTVSFKQCTRYNTDLKNVRDKKMSFQDFINNLQSGIYYRGQDNGFCEQVVLPSDEAMKMTKIEDYDEGKLRSVRIQQATSGGFSTNTKVRITPSIPFQMRFSAQDEAPIDIPIQTMTLYHPCPIRIESVQPDAVLSLNDPSFGNPSHVILVPLVAKNMPSSSVGFLQKILPQTVSVSESDPASGQYIPKDVPTGQNWKLSQLFDTVVSENGKDFDVKSGFYVWKGMPGLDRVKEPITTSIQGATFTTGFRFKWVDSGKPTPQYILIDTPVACNPADLAILTSRMPVTPPSDAIHAILYSSNPFHRGIVHKQGPPNNCFAKEAREGFTSADLQGAYTLGDKNLQDYVQNNGQEEEACDAWTLWAQTTNGKGFSTQQIIALIFNSTVFVAMCVGAYLAFTAITRLYDVEYSEVAKNIGKLAAVFAKNLQQKAAALQNKLSVGLPMGPGALKGLAAGNMMPSAGLSKLAAGPAASLTAAPGVAIVPPALPIPAAAPAIPMTTPVQGLNEDAAASRIQAAVRGRLANKAANIVSASEPVAQPAAAAPAAVAPAKKTGSVAELTADIESRGTGLPIPRTLGRTLRGEKVTGGIRRGGGHGGLTRRGVR